VRFIGSCSSLVVAKFKEERKLFDEDLREGLKGEPGIAYLLAAPIVLDTSFFKEDLRGKKW
jgi:inorganic pyrophosphatase/exopolyphosphatase